ncbi:MAG: preprotein translocase SecA subunit, partial [Actinomycetota bacterium]
MAVLDRILRAGEGKKVKALSAIVPEINALEAAISALSDDALRGKTAEFRSRIERGEDLDDLLVEAFAVVREASKRVIGQRHYDVQLMGGAALHAGWVAEMRTGEGKTL